MAQLVKADGQVLDICPANGTNFRLQEVQKLVDGYVELVTADKDTFFLMDEEGKLKTKPINHVATKMLADKIGFNQHLLVGDIVICNQSEFR